MCVRFRESERAKDLFGIAAASVARLAAKRKGVRERMKDDKDADDEERCVRSGGEKCQPITCLNTDPRLRQAC